MDELFGRDLFDDSSNSIRPVLGAYVQMRCPEAENHVLSQSAMIVNWTGNSCPLRPISSAFEDPCINISSRINDVIRRDVFSALNPLQNERVSSRVDSDDVDDLI